MPTLHVRKTGSDANTYAQAQNPATAWLTIDKAANNVVAGDTVYVGAGVYRETVTMDTAGTNDTTGRISFIADIDGAFTGDAGLVVISAHDSDTGQRARGSCWEITGSLDPKFITVRGFVMQGGFNAAIYHVTTSDLSYEGLIIEDCAILGGPDAGDHGIQLNYNAGVVPTGDGLRIRRCHIHSNGYGIYLQGDENATAERNIDCLIENCVIGAAGSGRGVNWDNITSSTFDLVGLKIYNNTFYGYQGIFVDNGSSTTSPVLAYNNLFQYCYQAIYGLTTAGMVTSDYNTFVGVGTPYTNVTQGGNDRTNTDATEVPIALVGGIADHPFRSMLGWSPWAPWEPIYLQGAAMTQSVIGDASATYAPADDLYGNPRPMGADGVVDNADDRGAVETRARPEQETTTVRTGSNAIRFEGAGYHDFLVPVAAQSTTITIYGRFDATYAGTLPSMTVTNDAIMTEVTDTMTVAAGNWEQLTSGAFTPSAAGVVRVRVTSSDTSTAGECFFDDLAVT